MIHARMRIHSLAVATTPVLTSVLTFSLCSNLCLRLLKLKSVELEDLLAEVASAGYRMYDCQKRVRGVMGLTGQCAITFSASHTLGLVS